MFIAIVNVYTNVLNDSRWRDNRGDFRGGNVEKKQKHSRLYYVFYQFCAFRVESSVLIARRRCKLLLLRIFFERHIRSHTSPDGK